MAITVTREPQAISPSKNPIIYHLQSDARIDNPGTAAINEIQFAGVIADGTIVAIRWKGVEQRMVARTTVSQPGFEFPAGTAGSAYLAQILPYFRDNYYLDEDFEVSSQTTSGIFSLVFTSRQPGTLYNFENRLIPGIAVQVKTAGIERKVKPNFSIYVEAWIEKADGSAFEKIFAESLQTDESGRTEWDLSDLLHPDLSPDIHQLEGRQLNKDINSKRRYYIRYAEAWGTSYQIGKITKGAFKHVTLGGTPYESGATVTVFDLVRESSEAAGDRALRLGPDVRYVYPDEPQFLTFLNTRTPTGVSLKVVAKLAVGGETSVLTIPLGSTLSTYGRATANVGYQQLNLNEIAAGNAVESYTVQFFSPIAPISRPYTFVLKYEYKPYRRYFVYVNSLGALDTMHTWGKNSQEIELVKRSAEKYLSPDYKLTDGTFADWDISYRQRFEAATGYRHAYEIRGFRDFYISRYKWRQFNNKALPITVLSNTLREYEDGASLIAQSFEYAYNFEDDTFSEQQDTPDQYAPPPGFQGAAGAPIVIKVPPFPGVGVNGNFIFDPEPLQGSYNLVRSGAIWKELVKLQSKLPAGLLGQYLRGDQTLGDFLTDSLQVVNNRLPAFKQEEFPQWIQDENSSGRIAADETIDAQGGGGGSRPSGLYYTPATSQENGWPVDGRKGALVRIVNGTAGSRTGSDMVTTSDGKTWVRTVDEQLGNGAWKEIGADARHPRFTNLPRITVTKGENFTRYIDLATYKTSYHTLTELTVEINLNTLKSKGLEVIKDGLLLTFSGKFLDDISLEDDNLLIYVTDPLGNQTTLSLKIGTLPDDPEPEPDTRPGCPIGPDFYGEPVVLSNGKVRFGFHAEGVPDLRVKFYVPGVSTAIRGQNNDLISYNNGTAVREIEFEPLAPGPYDMSIEGSLCKSIPDIKRIIIPEAPASIAWAEGYPLHETVGGDSRFVCKITGDSGSYSTKVINLTTLAEQYSASREYVAGVSEVTIPKTGGWPAGNYQIMVGTLTATVTVGEAVSPTKFLLKSGWDGAVIADLSAGPYNGGVPAGGFNTYLQSSELGFSYKSCNYKLLLKVAGVFTQVASGGFSVGSGVSSTLHNAVRIFPAAGVDSRYVLFNGSPLNRYGEFKIVYEFFDAPSGGNIVGTIQQEFKLNLIEITGNWKPGPTGGFPRLVPVVSGVKYNGVNMVADNVWAEPWNSSGLADRRVEYSVDLVNWYRTSSWFDYGSGTNSPSTLLLLNTPSIDLVDPLPSGKVHTVYLRDGMNHKVVSAGLRVDQGGVIGTEVTAKATTSGYPPHMKLVKTKTPTGWLITDESTVTPPSGYHIRYYINRQIIELPGSLTDYAYDNNKPLGIYKGIIRNGTTSLWGWANGDPGIGQTFSDNCSIAFETIIFNKK